MNYLRIEVQYFNFGFYELRRNNYRHSNQTSKTKYKREY